MRQLLHNYLQNLKEAAKDYIPRKTWSFFRGAWRIVATPICGGLACLGGMGAAYFIGPTTAAGLWLCLGFGVLTVLVFPFVAAGVAFLGAIGLAILKSCSETFLTNIEPPQLKSTPAQPMQVSVQRTSAQMKTPASNQYAFNGFMPKTSSSLSKITAENRNNASVNTTTHDTEIIKRLFSK